MILEPTTVAVPDGNVGELREAVILLHNLTNQPVSVLGATTSCSCVFATDKLPMVVPAKGTRELHVTLGLIKAPTGQLEQAVVYHTDHPAAPMLTARVTGRVSEP